MLDYDTLRTWVGPKRGLGLQRGSGIGEAMERNANAHGTRCVLVHQLS